MKVNLDKNHIMNSCYNKPECVCVGKQGKHSRKKLGIDERGCIQMHPGQIVS